MTESASRVMDESLHAIDAELTRPQKNLLRDGLFGLLRAGRPVVCRMSRKLPVEAQSVCDVSPPRTVTKPLRPLNWIPGGCRAFGGEVR